MKILLDTNVILDTFLEREPYNKDSDVIFDLIGDTKKQIAITHLIHQCQTSRTH